MAGDINIKTPSTVYWLNRKLYLNITNRCTNNCVFCFRKFRPGIRGFNLKLLEDPTSCEVKRELKASLSKRAWEEIVFCGFGEPFMNLDTLLEIGGWLGKRSHQQIRVNTNGHGFLIHPTRNLLMELKNVGVERFSVSLNAPNKTLYNKVCHPVFENAFENTLKFIESTRDAGFAVDATAVAIPEIRMSEVEKLVHSLKAPFRPRQYIPNFW